MNNKKNVKIFIAGHRGLVGSSITRRLKSLNYTNLVLKTKEELDLTDTCRVNKFFQEEKPDWVFLAAAKVGGIAANNTFPVEFMLENLKIQNNVIESSYCSSVKKLLFLGSSCIYPKFAPQPMKEEYLLSSALEPTNEPYALAKICGIKLCKAYNRQYKTNYLSVMPCNLYGYNDNYDEKNAHVIPMLIRRFHNAKLNADKEVKVWGSGNARREFMFADDLAKACVFLMENKNTCDIGEFINIGTGYDISIKELSFLIKETVGYKGDIVFDTFKPDGTPFKLMDVSKINSFGFKPSISLKEGLKLVYEDFQNNITLRL